MSGTNPSTDPLAPYEPYRWGAKPESLEAKFKMLALLPFNRGAKRKHSLVLAFLLDWYHSKYGNALASVRHILDHLQARDPEGKGLFAGDVHSALADLIAWGFLEQEKGSGRRASRYVPKWDILDSVRDSLNARGGVQGVQHSVRETPNESVRETPNATDVCVRDSLNEDPSTRTRLQDRGTGVDEIDCAAPSAPPAPAPLGGDAAGTAQEGFEELWNAYGHRQKIREARAAYKRLAPTPELHAQLVEAAQAWREGWAAQGKKDAPRYTLAKWLEREEYECEPPTGYTGKAKPKAANTNRPAASKAASFMGEIVDSEVRKTPEGIALDLRFDGGEEVTMWLEHYHEETQYQGQRQFALLQRAVGLSDVDDSSELHGVRLGVIPDSNGYIFRGLGEAA